MSSRGNSPDSKCFIRQSFCEFLEDFCRFLLTNFRTTFFNYVFSVAQAEGDAFDPVDLHEEVGISINQINQSIAQAGAAGGFDLRNMPRNDEQDEDDGMTSETDSNSYSDIGDDEDVRQGRVSSELID